LRLERSDDINPGSLKPGFCIRARSPRTHLDHPCLGRASLVGAKPLLDEWMTTGQCKTKPTNVRTAARELTADALEALAQVMRNGASEHARIAAAAAILDRAHGKPGQAVKIGGDEAAAPVLVRWADKPSEATPDPARTPVCTSREC
jgi:hypothetical protein